MEKVTITVSCLIAAPIEKTWQMFTTPEHIMGWNHASPDWHTPRAENDLHAGGKFSYRMEARDGSFGFDFCGVFSEVTEFSKLVYLLDDERPVEILFRSQGELTEVTEQFEAEKENSPELQKEGWQAILNSFKRYVETYRF